MTVIISGDHPHAGKVAEYVEHRDTMWGPKPVFKTDDGIECFVLRRSDYRIVERAH